ncbi:TPA: hypothetical protein GE143_07985 [Escherichia coli]|uniref:hypothetical protein n=1 Tax=Citrobacter portucalensis TaxID=1639133 RepID=UPI0017742A5A|nr:hypothetical protein [Escherichia coli]HBV7026622.1 hypothetical protein [Escherichia coli]
MRHALPSACDSTGMAVCLIELVLIAFLGLSNHNQPSPALDGESRARLPSDGATSDRELFFAAREPFCVTGTS